MARHSNMVGDPYFPISSSMVMGGAWLKNPYVSTLGILHAPYPLWPSKLPTACVSKVIVTKRITHFSEHMDRFFQEQGKSMGISYLSLTSTTSREGVASLSPCGFDIFSLALGLFDHSDPPARRLCGTVFQARMAYMMPSTAHPYSIQTHSSCHLASPAFTTLDLSCFSTLPNTDLSEHTKFPFNSHIVDIEYLRPNRLLTLSSRRLSSAAFRARSDIKP